MRVRFVVATFAFLLIADTATKLVAPDYFAYQVGPEDWRVITNPHMGLSFYPNWTDLILLAMFVWPATRLAAAIIAAGSLGNMVWSWTGGVPNVFVSNSLDGTGWFDLVWRSNGMFAYNIADLCLVYGGWVLIASIAVWMVRSLYEMAQVRHPRVLDLASGGSAGTPSGDDLRDRLGAGYRDGLGKTLTPGT